MSLLEVTGLSVGFKVRKPRAIRSTYARVVDRIDLRIEPGEAVGLVGESGSGKSTAARAMLRLIPIESGTVKLGGTDITHLSARQLRPHRLGAQMVFQDPYSSLNPAMTIERIVGEPLDLVERLSGADRRDRVAALLARVGLGSDALDRYPYEFSGGQRQRIAIARALAPSPRLLVCDEAVSALDVSTQNQIIGLLRDLREELGIALLFIAHDLAVVRKITERTVVMYCGQIMEEGATDSIFHDPQHPYTRALLAAVPVPSPRRQRARERLVLAGDVPSPLDPPDGCRFHERCPLVFGPCSHVEPPAAPIGPGRTSKCHLHLESTAPVARQAIHPNGTTGHTELASAGGRSQRPTEEDPP